MAKPKAPKKPKKPVLVFPKIPYAARDAETYPSEAWQLANMRVLATQLLVWKLEYYYGSGAGSSVDDQEYDLVWRNMLFLESKYPHLKENPSVTDNPGAPLLDNYLVTPVD